MLQEKIQTLEGKAIPGEMAFRLYDTYGFPVDLTADIARESGLSIDMASFNQAMQQQRELSQSASQFTTDYSVSSQLDEASVFHGYEKDSMQSTVTAILCDSVKVDKLTAGRKAAVVLENTPFYAESGGQVGDRGQLLGENLVFQVEDTQRVGQAIVHYGQLLQGELSIGQTINAKVDSARRNAIRLNHTATHLLHAALKAIVGPHVQQKGSLVDAERARFDFSHFEALTSEQLRQLENLVNDRIRANDEVETQIMSIDEAKRSGAVALFGEKYSDAVRVLSLGDFSKELCGGTHAARTGDIGLFKITAEYGVASGVRRIEMVTGAYAQAWINEQLGILDGVAQKLKTTPANVSDKLSQFLHDAKQQEKELTRLQAKLAAKSGTDLLSQVQAVNDVNLLVKQLDGMDSQALRTTLDQLKSSLDQAVIVLFAIEQEKINVVAGVSKNILGRVPTAAMLVKHLCGKGGGRDDMAQGGGRVPDDLEEKIAQIKTMIVEHVG